MQLIETDSIKRLPKAKEAINDLQRRLYAAESALDDLIRAVEIAKFGGQLHMIDVFCNEAAKVLEDRLELPDSSVASDNFANNVVITGEIDQKLVKQIQDRDMAYES